MKKALIPSTMAALAEKGEGWKKISENLIKNKPVELLTKHPKTKVNRRPLIVTKTKT